MFRLREAGCHSHALYVDITTHYVFCHEPNGSELSVGTYDVTESCDSHTHILNDIASIVPVLVLMYRDCRLA